jgi:anti-sigma B factor antagonist
MLDIHETESGGVWIVAFSGRLDAEGAESADAAVAQVLDRGVTRLVLDLTGVSYISSGGLRTVLSSAKRTKAAGGATRVAGASLMVRQVFDLSGLTQLIALDDTAEAAVRALAPQS